MVNSILKNNRKITLRTLRTKLSNNKRFLCSLHINCVTLDLFILLYKGVARKELFYAHLGKVPFIPSITSKIGTALKGKIFRIEGANSFL